MAVGDPYVFPGFLTPVPTQLFFRKPPTTFLTSFCRGERRKYNRKKSRLNRGSNSQPPGHESDTLTTEPPRRGNASCKNSIYPYEHEQSVQPDMSRNLLPLVNFLPSKGWIYFMIQSAGKQNGFYGLCDNLPGISVMNHNEEMVFNQFFFYKKI